MEGALKNKTKMGGGREWGSEDQWKAWEVIMWYQGQGEASQKISFNGADGHGDSMTDSAQLGDSVKITNYSM